MALRKRGSWQVFRSVVFALIVRELRTRFGKWRLGYAWAILEPLMMIIVFALALTFLRGRQPFFDIPVGVFIGIGFLLFQFWSSLAMRATEAITANSALFGYRQVKPFDTVLARAILETVVTMIAALILIWIANWFFGLRVEVYDPLRAMLVFLLLVLFAFGLGLALSVFGTLQSELAKLVPQVTRPMLFISGVFFPLAVVPQHLQPYLLWNPVLHAIEQMRFSMYPQYPADDTSLFFLAQAAVIAMAFGTLVYMAKRHKLVAS